MLKQTAVDWLVSQVNSDCLNSTFIDPRLIKQAKDMEKEQIKTAFYRGLFGDIFKEEKDSPTAEIYYNKTFL